MSTSATVQLFALPYLPSTAEYFSRIHQAPQAIFLDSGQPQAERGRFDIVSAWPLQVLSPQSTETGAAYLQRCRQALARLTPCDSEQELPFTGGLLGYLNYEFQPDSYQQESTEHSTDYPVAQLGLYDWALITDHQQQRCYLMGHASVPAERMHSLLTLFQSPLADTTAAPSFKLTQPFQAQLSATDYQQRIAQIHEYIRAGDCYQVNFTQRFSATYQGDPWPAYLALRAACPTPFSGFIRLNSEQAILSLSPERFLQVQQQQVEARPIKGTRPRDADALSDQANAAELLASTKDQAENLMIVDLLRNDLGRCCRPGSIQVPELFALESYPNVHHLVSQITGHLRDDVDVFDLIRASFPGGSITGAPKIRAMQIIQQLESTPRQIYCGSLLYLDCRGHFDSSIAIRTVLALQQQLHCWGGGGIVLDSEWQAEYQESIDKVAVLMRTLEQQFS